MIGVQKTLRRVQPGKNVDRIITYVKHCQARCYKGRSSAQEYFFFTVRTRISNYKLSTRLGGRTIEVEIAATDAARQYGRFLTGAPFPDD